MEIQLEFNIDNLSPDEMKFYLMQKQIDEMCNSMGKVRRRLFSELGEMKKICANLQKENQDLQIKLKELNQGKTEWTYQKEGCLFDVREYQKQAC